MFLDSGNLTDVLGQVAGELAKSVASNIFVSAMVLLVVVAFVVAGISKQQFLNVVALVMGVIAMVVIGGLSFGGTLPRWYGVLLAAIALIGTAGGGIALWRQSAKPKEAVRAPAALRQLDDVTVFAATTILGKVADEVAASLGIDKNRVRANVFAPTPNSCLRMVPGLVVGMNDPNELELEIPFGKGVVGTAWSLHQQVKARFDPKALDDGSPWLGLPAEQAAKVSKDLRWVIATPTPLSSPAFAWTVDLLEESSEQMVDATIPKLASWAWALDKYLNGVKLL